MTIIYLVSIKLCPGPGKNQSPSEAARKHSRHFRLKRDKQLKTFIESDDGRQEIEKLWNSANPEKET